MSAEPVDPVTAGVRWTGTWMVEGPTTVKTEAEPRPGELREETGRLQQSPEADSSQAFERARTGDAGSQLPRVPHILSLQRVAGNHAVSEYLRTRRTDETPVIPLQRQTTPA